jgi:hypothetical protein
MCLAGQLLTEEIPYASLEQAGIGLSDRTLLEAMAHQGMLPISADALARLLPQCRELLLAGLAMDPAKRATAAAQLLEMMPACVAGGAVGVVAVAVSGGCGDGGDGSCGGWCAQR